MSKQQLTSQQPVGVTGACQVAGAWCIIYIYRRDVTQEVKLTKINLSAQL